MKVLVNGATAGTNFGDFLFAKMFQDTIARVVGIENVIWFSSRYNYSQFYQNNLRNNNKAKLKEIDAMVYMSGGYFLGDDNSIKDYIIRYLRYYHIGIKCYLRKIPYGIFGVDVGFSKSKILQYIANFILRKSCIITVRNDNSYNCLKMLNIKGGGNYISTSDSVFAMERDFFQEKAISISFDKGYKYLFLHIEPKVGSNFGIIHKIVPVINQFCQNHQNYYIVIGADQYDDKQKLAFDEVRKYILSENVVFNKYDDPIALCNILDNCDVIVTHKLHVGIVGAQLGKSVISFSGHTSKIKRVYEQLNESERSISLKSLTYERGVEILEKFYNIPIVVPKTIREKAKKNFTELEKFLKQFT